MHDWTGYLREVAEVQRLCGQQGVDFEKVKERARTTPLTIRQALESLRLEAEKKGASNGCSPE